ACGPGAQAQRRKAHAVVCPRRRPAVTIRAVAIEKRSSIPYLRTLFERHAQGDVVLPLDADAAATFPGITLAERVACRPGGGWFREVIAPRDDDAPAQIALTSGTTGTPKAILLAHRALGDVTHRLVLAMGLDDTVREYV